MNEEVKINRDLNLALKDSSQLFKTESAEKINSYEKKLVSFKAKIAYDKKESKIQQEKKMAELKQKDNDMIKRLSNYTESGTENLELFRYEIGREMDELGKSLTVANI
jgi:hypothetical protein